MLRLLLVLIIASAGFALFGYAEAVQDPRIVHYEVPTQGLMRPLRIVQMSDTHASRIDMPAQRLHRIVAMANALKPDIIVLTGDYISGYPADWTMAETRAALAPLTGLSAPLGVFAVLGNHDGSVQTAAALQGTKVRLLRGTAAPIGPVTLVGADSLLRASPAVEAMRARIASAPADVPVVVITHEPEFFQWLEARRVTMISGHTHGGQIKLPIIGHRPISPFLDAHLRGLFREKGQTLLVSSGLGTSILPMRIGVPPEIVEIVLVPYSAGRKSGTDR